MAERVHTVLLVEDDVATRARLARAVAQDTGLALVGTAGSCGEARAQLGRLVPDVLLVDLGLPDGSGIDLIRECKRAAAGTEAMVITVFGDEQHVVAAIEAGASGYVLKDCSYDELALAIRKAMADQVHLSAELVGLVVKEVRSRGQPQAAGGTAALTPREREMVQLLSEGLSTQQIADRLHVSIKTVATHREHVMQKLDISSLAELTRYALCEGLSSLDQPWRSGARTPS